MPMPANYVDVQIVVAGELMSRWLWWDIVHCYDNGESAVVASKRYGIFVRRVRKIFAEERETRARLETD